MPETPESATTDAATDPVPNPPTDAATEERSEPDADVKQRFREALERKQAKSRNGQEHADARSKVHDAHGPASAKRTFRRKSG